MTRLFGNAGGVSVCIATGALYLLISSCGPVLQSISSQVLGKGGVVDVSGPREAVCDAIAVETGFAGSCRPCSVGCVAWVVKSCHGGGLCRPRMMMALEAPSFPLIMLVAWSPGWLLARVRVGILNFVPPSFCGDKSSAKNVSPGRGCACPVSGSIVPASGCSCPAPRGGSRAAQAMPWELSFAFFGGSYVCCKVVGAFPCSCCRALSAGFFFCKFPILWPSCY